ncbi:MAG: hypothetical protein RBT36_08385, partial [Desulfobulbus sp.]|nr:hypothetical protein [Desulfobulbus sp.]
MNALSLCYYSATATEIPSLSEGVRLYQADGGQLKVHARTQVQLFDEKRRQAFVREALTAQVLILSLHGGRASFPAFDLLQETLEQVPMDKRPL